jgi:hypothetical protein
MNSYWKNWLEFDNKILPLHHYECSLRMMHLKLVRRKLMVERKHMITKYYGRENLLFTYHQFLRQEPFTNLANAYQCPKDHCALSCRRGLFCPHTTSSEIKWLLNEKEKETRFKFVTPKIYMRSLQRIQTRLGSKWECLMKSTMWMRSGLMRSLAQEGCAYLE